jgi:sulfur-carrier protein adenylyltransferase/sulfurtransferase
LDEALGEGYEIHWHESLAERWRASLINADATNIRLRIPEAFPVHQHIIDWERRFSATGLPAAAIGIDPVLRPLMRFLMRDWPRMDLMNRYGGGTLIAKLEMDLLPGLFSAAHFSIFRTKEADGAEALLRTGEVLQRFWLTATRLGLAMQPSLAPLCFDWYARNGVAFTRRAALREAAERLSNRIKARNQVFFGRIGQPRSACVATRSLRRSLDELVIGQLPSAAARPERLQLG